MAINPHTTDIDFRHIGADVNLQGETLLKMIAECNSRVFFNEGEGNLYLQTSLDQPLAEHQLHCLESVRRIVKDLSPELRQVLIDHCYSARRTYG